MKQLRFDTVTKNEEFDIIRQMSTIPNVDMILFTVKLQHNVTITVEICQIDDSFSLIILDTFSQETLIDDIYFETFDICLQYVIEQCEL